MRVAFLLIAAILLQGTGNLCLSQGMKDLASTAAEHPIESTISKETIGTTTLRSARASTVVNMAKNPTKSRTPVMLSGLTSAVNFPMGAVDYALVTLAARYLLGEEVGPMRWAGVALIVTGVAITSATM